MPSTVRVVALWCFFILSPAVVAVRSRKLQAEPNDVAGMLLNILSEDEAYSQCRDDTEKLFATHNIEGIIDSFHNTLVKHIHTDDEDTAIITDTFSEPSKRSVEIVCREINEAINNEGLLVEAIYPLSCTYFDEEQGKELITFVYNYADCFANTTACEQVNYMEYLASRGVACTEIGKNEEPGIDRVGCLDGEVRPDGSFDLKFCNCDSDCTIDWLNTDTNQLCGCAAAQAADCCNGVLGPSWWNSAGISSKQSALPFAGMVVGAAAVAAGI